MGFGNESSNGKRSSSVVTSASALVLQVNEIPNLPAEVVSRRQSSGIPLSGVQVQDRLTLINIPSTMVLERARVLAAYANLVEQAILGSCEAAASCSSHEQELLASTGKDRPAGVIIANRLPGSPLSFKTVAHPVNESLEASTSLSFSLRIASPAGATSASNGREGKRWT